MEKYNTVLIHAWVNRIKEYIAQIEKELENPALNTAEINEEKHKITRFLENMTYLCNHTQESADSILEEMKK